MSPTGASVTFRRTVQFLSYTLLCCSLLYCIVLCSTLRSFLPHSLYSLPFLSLRPSYSSYLPIFNPPLHLHTLPYPNMISLILTHLLFLTYCPHLCTYPSLLIVLSIASFLLRLPALTLYLTSYLNSNGKVTHMKYNTIEQNKIKFILYHIIIIGYQSHDAMEGWRTYGYTCKVSVPPCWYCFLPHIASRDTGYTASTLKTIRYNL